MRYWSYIWFVYSKCFSVKDYVEFLLNLRKNIFFSTSQTKVQSIYFHWHIYFKHVITIHINFFYFKLLYSQNFYLFRTLISDIFQCKNKIFQKWVAYISRRGCCYSCHYCQYFWCFKLTDKTRILEVHP